MHGLRPPSQNRRYAGPSTPAMPEADPRELVTRALAILAEEKITCEKAQPWGPPQRRVTSATAGCLDAPQLNALPATKADHLVYLCNGASSATERSIITNPLLRRSMPPGLVRHRSGASRLVA